MAGLIEEGSQIIKEVEEGPVRDAMLIAAAQKVEHYEIASYGTLVALADKLRLDDAADILEDILDQEKLTDEKLNDIAEREVNDMAIRRSEEAGASAYV
jgi:ferritin-like metal-binding protein YciE